MSSMITEIDLGDGQILTVAGYWDPDPEVVKAKFIEMAQKFESWKIPLNESKQVMIESTRRRFQDENDPDGNTWAELNEDYWHRKVELGGYPDEILVRTGAMETAATSEEAWFVSEHEIFFIPEVLPKDKKGRIYGAAHQTGAQTGKGATLPQRAFIGADDEAEAEIEAIFLEYLDDTTAITMSGIKGLATGIPSGSGQMVRGAFGRFIGKSDG